MSDTVKTTATIDVVLDGGLDRVTVRDVRDWLAEVDRLHIPDSTLLDEAVLSVFFRSEIVEDILGESALGVEGYDILVGMPR